MALAMRAPPTAPGLTGHQSLTAQFAIANANARSFVKPASWRQNYSQIASACITGMGRRDRTLSSREERSVTNRLPPQRAWPEERRLDDPKGSGSQPPDHRAAALGPRRLRGTLRPARCRAHSISGRRIRRLLRAPSNPGAGPGRETATPDALCILLLAANRPRRVWPNTHYVVSDNRRRPHQSALDAWIGPECKPPITDQPLVCVVWS